MKKIILAVICCTILSCMNTVTAQKKDMNTNDQFNIFKENFVTQLWKIYPSWASNVGYHRYDSALVIPDDNARGKESGFCNANLSALVHFKLIELSDANKTDYHLIEN